MKLQLGIRKAPELFRFRLLKSMSKLLPKFEWIHRMIRNVKLCMDLRFRADS